MLLLVVFSVLFVTIANGSNIALSLTYDSFCPFRIMGTLNTDSEQIPSYISLSFDRPLHLGHLQHSPNVTVVLRRVQIHSISLSNNLPRIAHFVRGGIYSSPHISFEDQYAIMGISPGSPFSRIVESFILLPINDTAGALIVNPTNPSEYVLDGHWDYTTSLSTISFEVEASVSILRSDEPIEATDVLESPVNRFRFSSDPEPMMVSFEVMNALLHELSRVLPGQAIFETYPQFDGYRIAPLRIDDESIFDLLPVIRFTVNLDHERAILLPLFPRDYLRQTARQNMYSLLVIGRPDAPVFTLGQPLLSKMAIHLNGRNRTIGFGEPLFDLI